MNNHVVTLALKRRLNIFEAEIKMDMLAQTTPSNYALEIIDEETDEAMEYRHLTKHANCTMLFCRELGKWFL